MACHTISIKKTERKQSKNLKGLSIRTLRRECGNVRGIDYGKEINQQVSEQKLSLHY
jgi:hypothetical protein